MVRAIILARVSDPKQKIKGDSLEDQLIKCGGFIESQNWKKDREFTLIETGRKKERRYFQEVYEYCEVQSKTADKVDYLVVLNLGRFTRGGGAEYLKLKNDFEKIGVSVTDIYRTVGEKVNTLEDYECKYDWSVYSPTEPAEVYEANQRRDYVRDQLTQMIGGCIRNLRKGYWNGPAPYGLRNRKVDTPSDGIRNILEDFCAESSFVKKIYQMRADGVPDREIVDEINSLGFKTRTMTKRDKRTMMKIGVKGGVPLTVKKIQEWIINPIYCGVIVGKWTKLLPIKAELYDGIVDVKIFNQANRGKVFIIKNTDGSVIIKYNIKIGSIGNGDKRMRNNPNFPYKTVLRCPTCGKELKASFSRGRSGERFPAYFCDRNHERWSNKLCVVHDTVTTYIEKLKYSDSFVRLFEDVFMDVWEEKRIGALNDSGVAENNVTELVNKQKNILEVIKSTSSQTVRKALEDDYEKIETELTNARVKRDDTESKEIDVKVALRYAKYLMEHPKELLIDRDNMLNQRQMFGTIFEELPTYDDLINGTAKLQPIFQLKGNENESKSTLVQRAGVEPA